MSQHTLTGEFRLHPAFPSNFLDHTRDVIVYLPPDYGHEDWSRYPVLYLHDGQNLFDSATAFGGTEWEIDETVERLIRKGSLAPMIIVGIYNTGEHQN